MPQENMDSGAWKTFASLSENAPESMLERIAALKVSSANKMKGIYITDAQEIGPRRSAAIRTRYARCRMRQEIAVQRNCAMIHRRSALNRLK